MVVGMRHGGLQICYNITFREARATPVNHVRGAQLPRPAGYASSRQGTGRANE